MQKIYILTFAVTAKNLLNQSVGMKVIVVELYNTESKH